jgi:hypothetical protein
VRVQPHARKHIAPHYPRPRLVDPDDDEMSDDPNDDDDAWDDLDGIYRTDDGPAIAWLPAVVRYLLDLEVESALAPIVTPSSPFPTLRRLRC